MAIGEKTSINTKAIVKGSVPSEFAEHIWEEHIYTSPEKNAEKKMLFVNQIKKSTFAWPVDLQYNFAARVDQK